MEIIYTRRKLLTTGLSEKEGPYKVPLGYFLFFEADCHFGVLPPYNLLNKTLSKGRIISTSNVILEWQPFRINRTEYDLLKDAILENPKWGGEVADSYRGSRVYWERWAILRSVDRMAGV